MTTEIGEFRRGIIVALETAIKTLEDSPVKFSQEEVIILLARMKATAERRGEGI